jgi:predicted metal-dependent hydrolase
VKIEPHEPDFDPEEIALRGVEGLLADGMALFDSGSYLEAHEEFEKLWLANEAADADFFKGLVQAAMCLHHFRRGNLEGARKHYSGHRRCLAPFLPNHRGIDLLAFLEAMQRALRPALAAGQEESVPFPKDAPPRLGDFATP